MSISIKRADDWLRARPKMKQWAWFVALWCAGLFAVLAFTYPIKLLIRSMGH